MLSRLPRAQGTELPPVAALLVAALLVLGLAACSRHASDGSTAADGVGATAGILAPQPSSLDLPLGRGDLLGFRRWPYPLADGNRWDYVVRTRYTLVTSEGPQPPQETQSPWQVVINGTQHIGTRDYFLQSEWDPRVLAPPPLPYPVRRDRSGLYMLDPPVLVPQASISPGEQDAGASTAEALAAHVERANLTPVQREAFRRAATRLASQLEIARRAAGLPITWRIGGPDPGELSILRYPLYVGARWIVRDSPRFARAVTGREQITVPAGSFVAWRIRGTSELFGPNDRVLFWYADLGLARLALHAEAEATDDSGNIIGLYLIDQVQSLADFQLVTPGGPQVTGPALQAGTGK